MFKNNTNYVFCSNKKSNKYFYILIKNRKNIFYLQFWNIDFLLIDRNYLINLEQLMQELKLSNPFYKPNPFKFASTNKQYILQSSNSTQNLQKRIVYEKLSIQDKFLNYSLSRVNSHPIRFQKFAKQNSKKQDKLKTDIHHKKEYQIQNPFYRRCLLNNNQQLEKQIDIQMALTKFSVNTLKQNLPEMIKISSISNERSQRMIEQKNQGYRISFENPSQQSDQDDNKASLVFGRADKDRGSPKISQNERIYVKGKLGQYDLFIINVEMITQIYTQLQFIIQRNIMASFRFIIDNKLTFMNSRLNPKIIVLGQSNVGKTSIIQALIQQTFRQKQSNTVAAGFHRYDCKCSKYHTTISIDIWDTAGQQRYRSLLTLYYKNTDGAVIVFDVSNMKTFSTVLYWAEQLEQNCQKPCVMLVGNKYDLKETQNLVNEKLIKDFMLTKKGWRFRYSSAKTDLNIKQIFQQLTQMILEKVQSLQEREQSKMQIKQKLEDKKRRQKSCC